MYAIKEIRSYFNGNFNDRKFAFRCCKAECPGAEVVAPSAEWENDFKGELEYEVPAGAFLFQVVSEHSNDEE